MHFPHLYQRALFRAFPCPGPPNFEVEIEGFIAAPSFGPISFDKEVTTMIKKLQKLLSPSRRIRSSRWQFNRPLLEKQREDVFLLMHQQLGGMS